MTSLSCSVTNCIANENSLCCYQSIEVDSSTAAPAGVHTKDDTCCRSFADRSSAPTNSVSSANPTSRTDISCTVSDCQYNESKKCKASSITVQGDGASSDTATRCGTYKTR